MDDLTKQAHHWTRDELEVTLERSDLERLEIGTIFLVDPKMKEHIDWDIRQRLWPAVLEGLRSSTFRIYEHQKIFGQIRTERWPMLTRELVFLIEDPIRPLGAKRGEEDGNASSGSVFPMTGSLPWHVRGVLEARLGEYFIGFELTLEFPDTLNARWLAPLLKNPALAEGSPHLWAADDCYKITLSRKTAGRYGDPRSEPEMIIPESVRRHLDIIWAADRLAERFKDEPDLSEALTHRTAGVFGVLTDKLVAFYGDTFDTFYR
jgi:hypothetical protein